MMFNYVSTVWAWGVPRFLPSDKVGYQEYVKNAFPAGALP